MSPITLLSTPGARNLNHKVLTKIPGLLFLDGADFLVGDEMSYAMFLGKTMKNDRNLPKNPNAVKFYTYKVSKRLYGLIHEANHHLPELQKGNISLRHILNNHRQQEFWTFVLGKLRLNRQMGRVHPSWTLDCLLARAPDAVDDEAVKDPAELVGLFHTIPDECGLLFAASPPGRAASPFDDAVANAATVDTDQSSDTTEEQEE
ncbi:hypothetical protein CSAL01_04682 [Colletotrichum salicis]|uniref:Uncharacterized protein n=1 Tax=Colletotrichum salicis TaxID=1209931 RepID=A0A135UW10_9PEZI|nr:hypothetical protein CSAL01_04682 [Colletotrichum salicis]